MLTTRQSVRGIGGFIGFGAAMIFVVLIAGVSVSVLLTRNERAVKISLELAIR